MKKIYEDFFNKLDENEINFFKDSLYKIYKQKLKENEALELHTSLSIKNYNAFYYAQWKIKIVDTNLDIFILYLQSQGLVYNYEIDKITKNYKFKMTKLGLAFLEYIINK